MLRPPRRQVHRLCDLEIKWTLDGVKTGQVAIYLLVYNDVHFYAGFSPALENFVEPIILIKFAWPPKIHLRGKPPVLGIGWFIYDVAP